MSDDEASSRLREPGALTIGGPVDRASLTLGIHGEQLDPEEISSLLGCAPTHQHRRGDARKGTAPPWKRGAWLYSLENSPPALLAELVDSLFLQVSSEPTVWEGLRQRFDVQLGFGLFLSGINRGFELPHESLKRVAALGFTLHFDIYA